MWKHLQRWLSRKWQPLPDVVLADAYYSVFSTQQGQLVLHHLLNDIYFTIYEGTDPQEAVVINARRSVVHEILLNIDIGEHPDKYRTEIEIEAIHASGILGGSNGRVV